MNLFELNSETVSAHTTLLRKDAEALRPLSEITIPESSPSSLYRAAVAEAFQTANHRAEQFREEALRIADVMDLTVTAADNVDGSTCDTLGGLL